MDGIIENHKKEMDEIIENHKKEIESNEAYS